MLSLRDSLKGPFEVDDICLLTFSIVFIEIPPDILYGATGLDSFKVPVNFWVFSKLEVVVALLLK